MIFLTVGTQLGFDRLVQAVDAFSRATGSEVFGQIGEGSFEPHSFDWERYLPASEFDRQLEDCELIVAHAGMGIVLKALELHKPLLVLPRRYALGEHRNDHQHHTATELLPRLHVTVAADEHELRAHLDDPSSIRIPRRGDSEARHLLISRLGAYVDGRPMEPTMPKTALIVPMAPPLASRRDLVLQRP